MHHLTAIHQLQEEALKVGSVPLLLTELKKTTLLSFLDISGRCQKLHFQKQSLSIVVHRTVFETPFSKSHLYNIASEASKRRVELLCFCFQTGSSFGKSQLLNGVNLANQNKNKKARIFESIVFGCLHIQK